VIREGRVTRRLLLIQHAESEGPGLLGPPMLEAGLALHLRRADRGEAVPRTPDGYAGVIVMGGPMGVHESDRHPHLADEIALLAETLRRRLPALGICLGAQLLAAAAGARVSRAERPEIGWAPIALHDAGRADPVLRELPEGAAVFHWHGDTFELPPGATLLASSEACARQAFRIGRAAYGLQFHLEVTPEMVQGFAAAGASELAAVHGPGGAAGLVADARRFSPALAEAMPRIVGAFLRAGGLRS